MNMYKVLITGGAGYIGCVLTNLLLKKGFFVYSLDNLKHSNKKFFKQYNKNKNFNFYQCDINNLVKTEKFIKNNNPIYIKNTLNIDKKALDIINIIYNNYQVRNNIHTNFNTISYCKNNWNEHIDINIVTFLYSLNPIFLF